MPYSNQAPHPGLDVQPGHEAIDQSSSRYGVAVRDIFSGGDWVPAEPVRARDWRDCGGGDCVQSETTFD